MRRLMRLAACLYPAAWRARYGAEFEALLEDIRPAWRDVWNVAGGALKMQMLTWSFWKLVPALGLAGAIVMTVAAFTMQPVYESSAVIDAMATPDPATARRMDEVLTNALNREALSGIIAAERLYPGEKLEGGIARMRRNVRITLAPALGGKAGPLVMSFRYPDAEKAQHVVRRLVAQYQGETLDPASLPRRPIFPNRPLMIAVGLGAGLLLGVLYCARSGWKVVLICGAVGAPLGVYGFALALGRHIPQQAIRPLAIMGFVAGLLLGSIVVLLRRRKPVAG